MEAFARCTSLKSITIPDSVIAIGTQAFFFCRSLEKITIPENVITINNGAFRYCSALSRFTVRGAETKLENNILAGCGNLLQITCPNNSIAEQYARDHGIPIELDNYCGENLKWFFDPDTGTLRIEGSGDMYDYKLKRVNRNEDSNAPWNIYRSQIKQLDLPEGLTSIGSYAFYNFNLDTVVIPDGVTIIKTGAFYYHSANCVIIPDSVTEIEYRPFGYSTILIGNPGSFAEQFVELCHDSRSKYYQSDSVSFMPISETPIAHLKRSYNSETKTMTFSGTGYMQKFLEPDDSPCWQKVVNNSQEMEHIVIEDGILSISGLFVAYNPFITPYDNLKTITIPASVTRIDPYAIDFSDMQTDKQITIRGIAGSCAETFANEKGFAFEAIKNEPAVTTTTTAATTAPVTTSTTVSVPDSKPEITTETTTDSENVCGPDMTWSFDQNTGVLSITGNGKMDDWLESRLPDTVPWAEYRSQITAVVLSEGITSVGAYAFSDCTNLTDISLPDTVTRIYAYAFSGCTKLTSISLPQNLQLIGVGIFKDCRNLADAAIPASVTEIGRYAFMNCSSLTNVTVPDGTVTIGRNAFSGCPSHD